MFSHKKSEYLFQWLSEYLFTDVAVELVVILFTLAVFVSRARPLRGAKKLAGEAKQVEALQKHDEGGGVLDDVKRIKFLMGKGRVDQAVAAAALALSSAAVPPQTVAAQLFRNVDSGTQALRVLRLLLKKGSGKHDTVFNCALHACATHADKRTAQEILELMKTLNEPTCAPDVVSYNLLLKVYVEAGDLSEAVATLTEMRDAGFQPQDHVYNRLINAAVVAGEAATCWAIIGCMAEHGMSFDKCTLCIVMKMLRQWGGPGEKRPSLDLDNVKHVFDFVESSGVSISSDEVLLSMFIEACIWHREHQRLEQALIIYRQSDLVPKIKTSTILIRAAKDLRRIEWCWEFWNHAIKTLGQQPSAIMFGCMIDALVCCEDVAAAIALFDEWKDSLANLVTCQTLAKGLLADQRADDSMALWGTMREKGIVMNVQLYNMIIKCHALVGKPMSVVTLMKEMKVDGFEPDAITMTSLAKAHIVNGNVEQAYKVVADVGRSPRGGIQLDVVIFNILLDACYRQSRPDLVHKILACIEDHKVAPTSFTLGIASKLLSMNGEADLAAQVMERFGGTASRSRDRTSCRQSISSVSTVASMARNSETAFLDLLDLQGIADGGRFTSVIISLVQQNCLEKAALMVDRAYGLSGQAPALGFGEKVSNSALRFLLVALQRDPATMEKISHQVLEKLQARTPQSPQRG